MPLVRQPYAQIFSPKSQKSVNKNDRVMNADPCIMFICPALPPFIQDLTFLPILQEM